MASVEFDLARMVKDAMKRWPEPKPLTLEQQRGYLGLPKSMQEQGFPIAITTSPPVRIGSRLVRREILK